VKQSQVKGEKYAKTMSSLLERIIVAKAGQVNDIS
jgi:hypothetical protein